MIKGKTLIQVLKILLFVALMAWVVDRVEFQSKAGPASWADDKLLVVELEELPNSQSGKVFSFPGKALGSDQEELRVEVQSKWQEDEEGKRTLVWSASGPSPKESLWTIKIGFLHRLAHIHVGLFLLSFLVFSVCLNISGIRWWWLLRANSLEVSPGGALRLTWIGVFFNNVVPGLTGGDVVKAFYIARHTGKKTVPVLTVIVDRVLGLAALALLALIVVLWNLGRFPQELTYGIAGILLCVILFVFLFLSRRIRKSLKLGALLKRLPGAGLLMSIDQALTFYRTKKLALTFWLAASTVNHVIGVCMIVILGVAMGLHVEYPDYFVLVPVINIASAAPLAPGGWGLGEIMYDYAFVTFAGLAPGEGAGLSAVSRVVIAILSLFGGVLLLFMKNRASSKEIEEGLGSKDPSPPTVD